MQLILRATVTLALGGLVFLAPTPGSCEEREEDLPKREEDLPTAPQIPGVGTTDDGEFALEGPSFEDYRKQVAAHRQVLAKWRAQRLAKLQEHRQLWNNNPATGFSKTERHLEILARERQAALAREVKFSRRLDVAKHYVLRLNEMAARIQQERLAAGGDPSAQADLAACQAELADTQITLLKEQRPETLPQELAALESLVRQRHQVFAIVSMKFRLGGHGGSSYQHALAGATLAEALATYYQSVGDLPKEWLYRQIAVVWSARAVEKLGDVYTEGGVLMPVVLRAQASLAVTKRDLLRLAVRVEGLENLPKPPNPIDRRIVDQVLQGKVHPMGSRNHRKDRVAPTPLPAEPPLDGP